MKMISQETTQYMPNIHCRLQVHTGKENIEERCYKGDFQIRKSSVKEISTNMSLNDTENSIVRLIFFSDKYGNGAKHSIRNQFYIYGI